MAQDDEDLSQWIGRQETVDDTVTAAPVAALTATLDHPAAVVVPGRMLPPLWHWLYFLPMHRQSEIGPDGHARRGGFLPPVPLPRHRRQKAAAARVAIRPDLRLPMHRQEIEPMPKRRQHPAGNHDSCRLIERCGQGRDR